MRRSRWSPRGWSPRGPQTLPHAPAVQAEPGADDVVEPWLRAVLRCPLTGAELLDSRDAAGDPVLVSTAAGLTYPVRDGVPVLLPHEATSL